MSKIISWIALSVIFSSLLTVCSGKTCTKEQFITYVIHRMDPHTQRLRTMTETKKYILIVCCEGYKAINKNPMHPICEPKCRQPCGHGFCSSPNVCTCDEGYENSLDACVPKEQQSIPSVVEFPVERKPAFNVSLLQRTIMQLFTTTSTTTTRKPLTTTLTTTMVRQTSPEGRAVLLESRKPTKTTPSSQPLEPEQPVCPQVCRNGRCRADGHCDCIDGYTFDSESRQCRPLCNGKIYGCIHGTCVGYNQCRCDKGTDLLRDELFHCQSLGQVQAAIQDQSSEKGSFNLWYLLLLVIPCAVIVMSFCIIIRRWKQNKANRLEAQDSTFSEVRYFNSDNDHSVNEKHQHYHKPERHAIDGPSSSSSSGTIRRNGNVVIIHT